MSWYYGKPVNYASPPTIGDALLHFDGTGWQLRAGVSQHCGAARTVDIANARDAVTTQCDPWCRSLVVDSPTELRRAMKLVAAIAAAPRAFRSIEFSDDDPCEK